MHPRDTWTGRVLESAQSNEIQLDQGVLEEVIVATYVFRFSCNDMQGPQRVVT